MIEEINVDQMEKLVKEGAALIDCRETEEVEEGIIEGASHMALSDLDEKEAEFPKDKPVIFYCRSGRRSLAACEIAKAWTDKPLYSLAGGILNYKEVRP